MSLRVLEPGLQTLVVDFGRPHSRSLGVPIGGAADRTSLALGNALVGNPPDAAALEFCLQGPVLEAQCELACAVYGAPFPLHGKRERLRTGKTFTLRAGEVLEVGGSESDMRAYLCVAGGVQEKMILGSRSSLAPVRKASVLQCSPGRIRPRFARIEADWLHSRIPPVLRILDGPQAEWFAQNPMASREVNRESRFTVSKDSNRMGLRLDVTPPIVVPDRELVSEPVCPGSVQVTRDGQCIILGVDGQTIGGYPKIAQVISADLDRLGQLRPGSPVFFQRVTLEQAERLYRAKQRDLNHWLMRMRTSLAGIQ